MRRVHNVLGADVSSIVPWIVYPLLLVSLSVYGYRAYHKWFADPNAEDKPVDLSSPKARLLAELKQPGSTRPAADRKAAPGTAGPSTSAGSDRAGRGVDAGAPSGSLVDAVIREELEARRRVAGHDPGPADASEPSAESGPRRSGLFAGRGETGSPRLPVAEALAGIQLPDALTPLIEGSSTDPYQVRFVATDIDPAEMGAALGDELERLGFTMTSLDDTTARALRPDATLEVAIHPDAHDLRDADGERVFPNVPLRSTVVVFTA